MIAKIDAAVEDMGTSQPRCWGDETLDVLLVEHS
jgi:hypothetical protein